MDANVMLKTFPAAAEIAETEGATPYQKAQTLMTAKRGALSRLLAVINGKTVKETMKQGAAESVVPLMQWIAEGGSAYIRMIKVYEPETVCAVLYQYRPEDPEALYYLMQHHQQEQVITHYMASTLRAAALSGYKKGAKYPTLRDVLGKKKKKRKAPKHTGEEIMSGIFAAALSGKGDSDDDDGTGTR